MDNIGLHLKHCPSIEQETKADDPLERKIKIDFSTIKVKQDSMHNLVISYTLFSSRPIGTIEASYSHLKGSIDLCLVINDEPEKLVLEVPFTMILDDLRNSLLNIRSTHADGQDSFAREKTGPAVFPKPVGK